MPTLSHSIIFARALTWDAKPNGIGRLATTTSPDQVVTHHYYDTQGRSSGYDQIATGDTHKITWTYDAEGKLEELRYPSIDGGLSPGLTLKHQYNNAEYLREVSTRAAVRGDLTKFSHV
jgi:YD repeat-containing protein